MFCCRCALQDNGVTMTRRTVLGVIAAAALSGCQPRRSPRPVLPSADRAAVAAAADAERSLLEMYDGAIAQLDAVAAGPLSRARDRHSAHLRALSAAGRSAPTAASESSAVASAPVDHSALTAALTAGAATLRATAVRVGNGRLAALLASVAAEHAADAVHTPQSQTPGSR
jgi:hypothetical protein